MGWQEGNELLDTASIHLRSIAKGVDGYTATTKALTDRMVKFGQTLPKQQAFIKSQELLRTNYSEALNSTTRFYREHGRAFGACVREAFAEYTQCLNLGNFDPAELPLLQTRFLEFCQAADSALAGNKRFQSSIIQQRDDRVMGALIFEPASNLIIQLEQIQAELIEANNHAKFLLQKLQQ